MRTTGLTLVAVMLVAAGCLRMRTYLRTRSPRAGYLMVAALCAGFAALLNAVGPYRWSDRVLFHHPNISVLVSHLLTTVGAAAAVEMVATLVTADGDGVSALVGRRLRGSAEVLVIVAMVGLFAGSVPAEENPLFFEHYRNDSHLLAYWCVFLGAAAMQLGYVSALTLRYTRHDDKWLRRGLRLIGYGSAFVALFLVSRIVELAPSTVPSFLDPLAVTVLGVGGVLIAVGVLAPQVGLFADRAVLRRQIRPVWVTVTGAFPQVRAGSTRPSLYRAVIEIQDAVAEARAHQQLTTPLLVGLDSLSPRPAEEFASTVQDILAMSARVNDSNPSSARISSPA